MSIFRIYPTRSNTIASGAYESYNAGQSPITELWYGGGSSSDLYLRNSISRFMIYFDLTHLQSKMTNYEINQSKISQFTLNLKNAIPRKAVLDDEFQYDTLSKYIATSFDLICFPINQDWDEGRGQDLLKEVYTAKQSGNPHITGYSNWNNSKLISTWTEPGIYNNPTASTAFVSSQHFDLGSEDMRMDVTDIVNNWLSGGTNYGFAVGFSRPFELISGDSRFISSFYTEKTNSSFKPFLEVTYDQTILDDRKNMSTNRMCRLFLYTYSGNNSVNYFSASTVSIKNSANADIITGLTPTLLTTGSYYVDVWMSSATIGQKYFDVWCGVTFNPGYDKQDYRQYFIIGQNPYTSQVPSINEYSLFTYGLDNDSIVNIEEQIRVFCQMKVNYTNKEPSTPYILKYKLSMNNQSEIIPWTIVNRTIKNNCVEQWFEFDTTWLLHNQTYKIEFMIEELGTKRILPDQINFKTIRSFS